MDLALFEGDMMACYQHKDTIDRAADEYFNARDYSELVNSRDFALIAHYKEKKPRGDPLVEFVIDNYDALLDVAPEITLARLVLEINFFATLDAALEPDSELLYDSVAARSRGDYLAAAGLRDELLSYIEESLGRAEVNRAGTLRSAARGDATEAENVLKATLAELEGREGVSRLREILRNQLEAIRQ